MLGEAAPSLQPTVAPVKNFRPKIVKKKSGLKFSEKNSGLNIKAKGAKKGPGQKFYRKIFRSPKFPQRAFRVENFRKKKFSDISVAGKILP